MFLAFVYAVDTDSLDELYVSGDCYGPYDNYINECCVVCHNEFVRNVEYPAGQVLDAYNVCSWECYGDC